MSALSRRSFSIAAAAALISVPAHANTRQNRNLIVFKNGTAKFAGRTYRCALGKAGLSSSKQERDLTTPIGAWPIREIFYRADRVKLPRLRFPVRATRPTDGWCDAPSDANYNRHVDLPYPASAEQLWRNDGLYDVVAILGYNDDPVVPGRGSAIFLHVARPNYGPTAGCVALAREDLLHVLARCDSSTRVIVMT